MAEVPNDINARRIQRLAIFNAGRQHSDQLAAAMIEAGIDTRYIHGAPIRMSLAQTLMGSHEFWKTGRVIARSAEYVLPFAAAQTLADTTYRWFDRRAAHYVRRNPVSAVIGYESSSLRTFQTAKALGLPIILDAADVHFSMQDEEKTPFRLRVNARKSAELALADNVLTCSTLARDSYIAAGSAPERVHAIPLGVDLAAFGSDQRKPLPGPLRLAFVGRFTRKKGADLVAHALDTLATANIPFECRIAADTANAEPGYIGRLSPRASLLGKLSQSALPELYHWADALVIPSRFDSFGLVVLEALACGLPVISSNMVGAKDYIVPDVNGAIFDIDNADQFANILVRYAMNPDLLRAMRPAASVAAASAGWADYRRRIAEKIEELVAL